MANIFGILTTLVLIVAAFVAVKNKARYENEIAEVGTEKANLKVSQDRLATAQQTLAATNAEIPVVQARHAELLSEGEQQRTTNTQTEAKITELEDEISRGRQKISDLQEEYAAYGNLDQLVETLRTLQADLAVLEDPETGVLTQIANVDRINATATRIEAENTVAQGVLDGYERGESRPGMTTRIRSIYPTWGFATLAAGGISGVAANATMDVIRDNKVIAKLRVTAVEPNSSSATIIPSSVAEDVVLAVGDLVVPGTRAE